MRDFQYKTDPDEHQEKEFLLTRDNPTYAHLWETGTGKSKVAIDQAAYAYMTGSIDALVVIAPNGVHTNWVTDELPLHMPDWANMKVGYWTAQMNAANKRAWQLAKKPGVFGLRVFVFNVEGFLPKGRATAELRSLLNALRCMVVIDESQTIGVPSTKRTRVLVNLCKDAPIKRILTGTWIDGKPLKAYSQFAFLDRSILGFQTYTAFKSMYAITERRRVDNKKGWYDHILGFQNLPDLARRIAPYATILYKHECNDLPPKVYEKMRVDLTDEQRRHYDALVEEGVSILGNDLPVDADDFEDALLELFKKDGDAPKAVVDNALTLLLRLQQIVGGYLPLEDGALHPLKNNRLNALASLVESLEGSPGKVIIWARFTREIDDIMGLLGDAAVRYDGQIDIDERAENKRLFINDPSKRFFVGNPSVGAKGLTLVVATNMIYYSQDFSRDKRKQSEDRAHRRGQKNRVTYFDFICPGRIDAKISRALVKKERDTLAIETQIRDIKKESHNV